MKILYITTVGMTMGFFDALIRDLLDKGHSVDIASNEAEFPVPDCYREWGCRVFPLCTSRSPFRKENLHAVKQIRELVTQNRYDIVHCHTPVAAACTRLACIGARKKGTKVFYTAHGLHFFKGAPLANWLVFFPVEWLCAFFTDLLVTINREDYQRACRHLHAKKVVHVPGVGLNVTRFMDDQTDKQEKRKELGFPEDAAVLLSVGELNQNKNQQVILRAMALLEDKHLHYMLAGRGPEAKTLEALAEELGLRDRVHLLGQRKDVPGLCKAADIFCFPSRREGLGLAALEAMAAGLPLVTSNVHGINDYSENGVTGYKCDPDDAAGFAEAIRKLIHSDCSAMAEENRKRVRKYDVQNVIDKMNALYFDV